MNCNTSVLLMLTLLTFSNIITPSTNEPHIIIPSPNNFHDMITEIRELREEQKTSSCISCGFGTAIVIINILGLGALALTDYLQMARLDKIDDSLSSVNSTLSYIQTPQINTTSLIQPLAVALAPPLAAALAPSIPTINSTALAETISSTFSSTLSSSGLSELLKTTLVSNNTTPNETLTSIAIPNATLPSITIPTSTSLLSSNNLSLLSSSGSGLKSIPPLLNIHALTYSIEELKELLRMIIDVSTETLNSLENIESVNKSVKSS